MPRPPPGRSCCHHLHRCRRRRSRRPLDRGDDFPEAHATARYFRSSRRQLGSTFPAPVAKLGQAVDKGSRPHHRAGRSIRRLLAATESRCGPSNGVTDGIARVTATCIYHACFSRHRDRNIKSTSAPSAGFLFVLIPSQQTTHPQLESLEDEELVSTQCTACEALAFSGVIFFHVLVK